MNSPTRRTKPRQTASGKKLIPATKRGKHTKFFWMHFELERGRSFTPPMWVSKAGPTPTNEARLMGKPDCFYLRAVWGGSADGEARTPHPGLLPPGRPVFVPFV